MAANYLTPDEVAEELRVDVTTVWRWMREGKLRHLNLGYRTKRVTRQDLDAFKAQSVWGGGACN